MAREDRLGGAPVQRLRRCAMRCGTRRTRGCCRSRPASRRSTASRPRHFSGPWTTCSSTTPAPRGATARPRDNRRCAMPSGSGSGCRPRACSMLAGAQQGLDLLARCLIDPGDAVIIDRPGYLGAIQSFRAAGAKLIGWDVARADIDELEDLLVRYRPKLIYTNPTFQNPDRDDAADPDLSRAAQAGGAVPRPDRGGRDLSGPVLPRGPAAVAARPRRAEPRHPSEQLFESHGARGCGSAGCRRRRRSSIRSRSSSSGSIRTRRTSCSSRWRGSFATAASTRT